jgi:hypothetical protein
MGSKTRIYIVLEFVMGGELHDIIVSTVVSLPMLPLSFDLIILSSMIIYIAC